MEHYYIWSDIRRLLFFSLHYKVAYSVAYQIEVLQGKIVQSQMYFEVFKQQISLIN